MYHLRIKFQMFYLLSQMSAKMWPSASFRENTLLAISICAMQHLTQQHTSLQLLFHCYSVGAAGNCLTKMLIIVACMTDQFAKCDAKYQLISLFSYYHIQLMIMFKMKSHTSKMKYDIQMSNMMILKLLRKNIM